VSVGAEQRAGTKVREWSPASLGVFGKLTEDDATGVHLVSEVEVAGNLLRHCRGAGYSPTSGRPTPLNFSTASLLGTSVCGSPTQREKGRFPGQTLWFACSGRADSSSTCGVLQTRRAIAAVEAMAVTVSRLQHTLDPQDTRSFISGLY
jgi:hypothetical protein